MIQSLLSTVQSTPTRRFRALRKDTMKLLILVKNVYGKEMFYPYNQPARGLAAIAGTKTFTAAELMIAQNDLGFEIEFLYAAQMQNPLLAALAA